MIKLSRLYTLYQDSYGNLIALNSSDRLSYRENLEYCYHSEIQAYSQTDAIRRTESNQRLET